LERGQIHERLEERAGLAPGSRRVVELALGEAPAADEGADLSGRGLDRDHRGLERVRRLAPRALGLSQSFPHRRFRCVLQAPIEAGDQLYAAERFAAAL